jgi:3-phenylpropionate/trans-cinnamate dioxygenase ferredoxin subunit
MSDIVEDPPARRVRQRKRHVVATRDELPPGTRKIVKLGLREIGLFRVGDELYALANICPHHMAPLCLGALTSEMVAGPDREFRLEREGMVIRCPWHQFEFDIETGRNLADGDKYRVAVYPAMWEGEEAVVYV